MTLHLAFQLFCLAVSVVAMVVTWRNYREMKRLATQRSLRTTQWLAGHGSSASGSTRPSDLAALLKDPTP